MWRDGWHRLMPVHTPTGGLSWKTQPAVHECCSVCLFSRQNLLKSCYVGKKSDLQNTGTTESQHLELVAVQTTWVKRSSGCNTSGKCCICRNVWPLLFVVLNSPGGNIGEIFEVMISSWGRVGRKLWVHIAIVLSDCTQCFYIRTLIFPVPGSSLIARKFTIVFCQDNELNK